MRAEGIGCLCGARCEAVVEGTCSCRDGARGGRGGTVSRGNEPAGDPVRMIGLLVDGTTKFVALRRA